LQANTRPRMRPASRPAAREQETRSSRARATRPLRGQGDRIERIVGDTGGSRRTAPSITQASYSCPRGAATATRSRRSTLNLLVFPATERRSRLPPVPEGPGINDNGHAPRTAARRGQTVGGRARSTERRDLRAEYPSSRIAQARPLVLPTPVAEAVPMQSAARGRGRGASEFRPKRASRGWSARRPFPCGSARLARATKRWLLGRVQVMSREGPAR
jgi:hypothetical protein